MKTKLTKISDEDFDGLLPSATPPPERPLAATKESDQAAVEPANTVETASAFNKASKSKKGKQAKTGCISVRLEFSTQEYKSLMMLALDESDKTGKKVSVTRLLSNQANKLIGKGNSHA